jgi:peptide/nickel transport system permease protein
MKWYIVRRLVLIIPTIFIVSILVFSIVRLIPGNVVELMVAEQGFADDAEELESLLGLDKPVYTQYFQYVTSVFFKGDFGVSLWSGEPVRDEILQRLPVSIQLGSLALFFTLLLGIPVGIISALKQDSILDYTLRSWAIAGLSIPSFWVAVLFLTFGALWFEWVPPRDYIPFTKAPLQSFKQLLAPAFIMSIAMSAGIMRMTRTMMLEVMREDYIRTARSKGLSEFIVIVRHALKNALIPILTIIGMQLTLLVGGTVIMEQIFVLPGMGKYMLDAITWRDYPVIQGINLLICFTIITMNLVVDILYGIIDPRIRYG